MTDILALLKSHAWVPLAALLIHVAIRLLKDDVSATPTVPSKWRPWLALVLGAASGIVDKVADGATWTSSIGSGLVAALIAMAAHDTIIESARGGREIGEPKSPLSKPEALAKIVPPATLLALVVALGGCSSLGGKGPATAIAVGDIVACVLEHHEKGETVAEIAKSCEGVAIQDVIQIVEAHKRAMAKDAACAPTASVKP